MTHSWQQVFSPRSSSLSWQRCKRRRARPQQFDLRTVAVGSARAQIAWKRASYSTFEMKRYGHILSTFEMRKSPYQHGVTRRASTNTRMYLVKLPDAQRRKNTVAWLTNDLFVPIICSRGDDDDRACARAVPRAGAPATHSRTLIWGFLIETLPSLPGLRRRFSFSLPPPLPAFALVAACLPLSARGSLAVPGALRASALGGAWARAGGASLALQSLRDFGSLRGGLSSCFHRL